MFLRPFVAVSLLCLAALAAAQGSGGGDSPAAQTPTRDLGGDRFVFGGSVRIELPVAGDLIAAGGQVEVEAPVGGDAVLAGGNVRVAASVGQDVYAAGGRLALDAEVGRNLRVAGGQVDTGPKASIAGNVTVAGGQVRLRAPVKGSIRAAGGRVVIDAEVGGDVSVTAGQLELGPHARIAGGLRYRGRDDIRRDPAARVAGAVEHIPLPGADKSARSEREHGLRSRLGGGASWLWTLGLMAIAAVLVALLPGTSDRVARTLVARSGWSLLLGFITLVCVPVATLVLLLTVIGIPLALLVVLLYLVLLLVGYVASGVALGQWALARWRSASASRTGWRIAAAMLAVLLLAVLARIPFVGGFVVLAAMLAGIGAIALQLAPARTPPPPTTQA